MHHKRHGSLRKNKGLIICISVSVLLCVWSSIFSLFSIWDPLRDLTVTVSSPLTGVWDRMGSALAQSLEALRTGNEEYSAWQAEKKEWENKFSAQEEQLKQLQQLQLENEQLRDYLSLAETHASLTLLEARTIYTADTTGRLLTLNRGSRDGVKEGMPVIDSHGVMGMVCEVESNNCKVITLLDETMRIGVRDVRSGISGTLCGARDGAGYGTLKYLDANIDRETDLRIGDIIVTSGGNGNFPAEMIVGRVVEIGVDTYDRSPYAYIELSADLDDPSALLMIVTGEEITDKEEQKEPSESGQPDGEGKQPTTDRGENDNNTDPDSDEQPIVPLPDEDFSEEVNT